MLPTLAVAIAGCHAERPAIHAPPAPAAAAPLVPTVHCATSRPADPAIGVPVEDPRDLMHSAQGLVRGVVSRTGRNELVAVVGSPSPRVELSTDGGQHFAPVLERRGGEPRVVLDCAGNLAVARDDVLGVRTTSGDETWRTFPFASRGHAIALYAVAGAFVWFHGDGVAVSVNGGATWHQTPDAVARALDRNVPDHAFVVAGAELDAVEWNGLDDRTTLVRFDPLRGVASEETVHFAYDDDAPWMSATHTRDHWEVRLETPDLFRCDASTPRGVTCVPPPARLPDDDGGPARQLLPRLVGGSSDGDLPVTWCRARWSGHDCAVLAVRGRMVVREPYATNGSATWMLARTPAAGPVLPPSFAAEWLVGFDGGRNALAIVEGVLLRWSEAAGWRALAVGVEPPMWAALADAATPRPPDPDAHPLAAPLRAGFGTSVWRCAASGCALHLAQVRCASSAGAVTCDAIDPENAGAKLHAVGPAAAQVSAALADDVQQPEAASVTCVPWTRNVHCGIVATAGDETLAAATAHFQITALGQRSRTPDPVDARCGIASCVLSLAGERETVHGRQAAVLSHVLAKRRGQRCASEAVCQVAERIACESSGLGDGGLTSIVTCSVTPAAASAP